jgi:hypothetical protein
MKERFGGQGGRVGEDGKIKGDEGDSPQGGQSPSARLDVAVAEITYILVFADVGHAPIEVVKAGYTLK